MNERVQIIEYKNKKIILVDLSNLSIEEILNIFPIYTEMALSTRINLVAMDITNTYTDKRIKEESIESSNKVRAALGEQHIALVGIRGIQKIIANAINRNQHFAATREEAYEWLFKKSTEQAQKLLK
jgi:hypothetical protein